MFVKKVDLLEKNASALFTQSLKETGFAVITNHSIDFTLVTKVYKEWQQFFASEEKQQYLFDREGQDGFFPMEIAELAKGADVKDIKEFFQYYPWGQCPKENKSLTNELYQQLSRLAAKLLQFIENNMPTEIAANLSMHLSDMIHESPRTMLRILHYPPLTGSEEPGAIRAAAHEDINLITLLPSATASGLQVKDVHGKWHEVPCDPQAIIVNTGDMLQECTQGYYKATTHRVVNPEGAGSNQARLSMPLFLHPRDEVVLSQRHSANSYRLERLTEIGLI